MAEKRLIDANALLALVADDLWAYEVEQFEHYVSKAPTVDAVEVVRCRDCKWWKTPGCFFHAPGRCVPREENDFCSDGERKDNNAR